MKSDIPAFIVKIKYKGDASDPECRSHCRYLYIYAHESLNERMAKAWRKDASAEVIAITGKLDCSVSASRTKGVWS